MTMGRIAVGKIIQGLRKAKGITQEQLSEVIGVSAAAISKWENEQMYPDISYFPILARYFNVSIDCLFGFSNELSKQDYQDKIKECEDFFKTKDFSQGLEKIKAITYQFPANDRLKIDLVSSVIPYLALAENLDIQRRIALQLIAMCEVCTDEALQVKKHFVLAHLFMLTGECRDILPDTLSTKNKNQEVNIDISNGLLLKTQMPDVIHRIDLALENVSTQLMYEFRNKISYLLKIDDLRGALNLLKKQVTLVGLLELDQSFYYMLYLNISYLCCRLDELDEAKKAILEFVKLFQKNSITHEIFYQVYKKGFSSSEFDVIRKTTEFKSLEAMFKED